MDKDLSSGGINRSAALTLSILVNGLLIGYLVRDYKELIAPVHQAGTAHFVVASRGRCALSGNRRNFAVRRSSSIESPRKDKLMDEKETLDQLLALNRQAVLEWTLLAFHKDAAARAKIHAELSYDLERLGTGGKSHRSR